MAMREAILWALVALSSVCAGIYGYHRFKLIRPDLFGQGPKTISESERAARIAEYQQKGDALSRAAAIVRAPQAGERCDNGIIVAPASNAGGETKPVIANGQPVRCTAPPAR